jgi:two-component system, NtrC family, response regulator AtoC
MRPLLVALSVIQNVETRSLVRMVLEGTGHRVIESGGYPQAQLLLNSGLEPDLLLVESTPEGSSGTVQLVQLLKGAPKHSICLITRIGEQALRDEASGLGIRRFLTKPVTRGEFESMLGTLNHPVEQSLKDGVSFSGSGTIVPATDISANMHRVPHLEELGGGRFFLAASPAMLKIKLQVRMLANVDANVLILGESGTGKEVIAHLIHKHSRRSAEKFLNVNCAALPADLLESELFGHRQGAFTGALKDRPGKFEQANHGTLLLDEIGEMSALMQAKLLHVLQDGQFTPLGGQESIKVDVRVLAATNIQMERALLNKAFREDLYYRLNAFTIEVPPLRERREEIPYLIDEILRRTPAEMKNGSNWSFSTRLIDATLLHDWPGNLRELHNFVTRVLVMQDEDAAICELETKIARTCAAAREDSFDGAPSDCRSIRAMARNFKDRAETQMIQAALDATGWNRRHAAQQLNISYRTILYKIRQHQLAPRRPGKFEETSHINF